MKFVKYIRLLLLPISLIYGCIVCIRNRMFDLGKLPIQKFDLPIISVGNITVGGTGKTPLTEFIILTLQDTCRVALLSRGYKRKTKGVVMANGSSSSFDIGDEPKQILDKFKGTQVVVAEKRVEGINKLLSLVNPPDVIVMDDAYQHRYVKPGLSILVMDYSRPLWKDFMLPAGELREPMKGKDRADIVLVSKCPSLLSEEKQNNIIKKLNLSTDQSVYFSAIGYQKPISLFCNNIEIGEEELLETYVLLVTGIANPKLLFQYVKKMSKQVATLFYPDHYQFTRDDVNKIKRQFDQIEAKNKIVMTTEKDSVRFRQVVDKEDIMSSQLWYLPIEIRILNNQQNEFKEKIITYANQNKRNC